MSSRRVKYDFQTGEHVLCFEPDSSKAKVLYDAKILDVSVSTDKKGRRKPSYLIHFLGWNNSWDRVVPESFLLRNTDLNRILMKKLETISQRVKKNKVRMKKIDSVLRKFFQRHLGKDKSSDKDDDISCSVDEEDDDDENDAAADVSDEDDDDDEEEDSFSMATEDSVTQSSTVATSDTSDDESEPNEECLKHEPVCLDLPEPLKRKLERDCYLIKRQKKRLKLPAVPNVVTILEGYLKCFAVNVLCVSPEKQRLQHQLRSQKQQAPDKSIQLCKEMVDGLRVFFDFMLPLCLLHEIEMAQYKDVVQKSALEQPLTKAGSGGSLFSSNTKPVPLTDLNVSRQKHREYVQCHDVTENDDSNDRNSTFSEAVLKTNVKKEAEICEKSLRRVTRVTRNFSGLRELPKSHVGSRSNLSPTRSCVSKSGGTEKFDTLMEEHPRRSERETRLSCSRALLEGSSCDPPVGEGIRSSRRRRSTSTVVKSELSEVAHPCLHFESEPSEVSSHVSQFLSARPEMKAICSQKEKEVSNIFAWKLVPDELQSEIPVPPSFVYGAHHLLRLFVPLPDLLNQMEIPANVQTQLVQHLQLFLDHLVAQCEELFPESSYVI